MFHSVLRLMVVFSFIGMWFSSRFTSQENPQTLGFQDSCDIHDSGGTWSPDGKSIAFMSSRSGNIDIWVMEADGSNPRNLTKEFPLAADYNPVWSPDGKYIVFSSTYESGRSDIWLIGSNGSNPQNLTSELEQDGYFFNISPVWSPDGNFITFAASSVTEADIMVVDMRDISTTNITASTDVVFIAPSWLSDSLHVAFLAVGLDTSGLWVAKRDGSKVELIASQYVDGIVGSPTRNMIAFASGDFPTGDDALNIHLISLDGNSSVALTDDQVQLENFAAWSPDGNQIAFAALSSHLNRDIWIVNVDGSGLKQLTTSDSDDTWPIWSPDGRYLTFTSSREDKSDVWIMNADGTNQVNLTGISDCNG